jgi:multisubunit Na+/H+ antiporter MnhF subunit
MTSNEGPSLLAGCWAAAAVATIIVILRVVAKLRIHQFKLDDIAMIIALVRSLSTTIPNVEIPLYPFVFNIINKLFLQVLSLASSCCLTVAVKHGFGRHVQGLKFSDRVTAVEFFTLHQSITILGTAIGRMAFITYLWALLGGQKLHQMIFGIIITLQIIVNSLSVIFIFVQCRDVRALWNPHITSECWSVWGQIKYSYFQCCKFFQPSLKSVS